MAIFCAFSFINAQETKPAPNNAPETPVSVHEVNGNYIETFRRDLSVNDDQLGRIKVLHTETVNRYNSIEPQYLQSNDVYRSRVQQILTERDERLRTILTPDQFSRYNANRSRYIEYDSRNFTDDLNQRRNLGTPDMKQAPADGQRQANPSETRPANPSPTMDNQRK